MNVTQTKAGRCWTLFVMAMSLSVCAGLMLGCSDDGDSTGPDTSATVGRLVEHSDCGGYPETVAKAYVPADQTGVVWTFDGEGTLTLQHINAAFNCCPEISCAISVSDNTITITETETGTCDCLCLMDLDCEVSGLTAGTYDVRFVELHLNDDDQKLEFPVTLKDTPAADTLTVPRGHYPWVPMGPPLGALIAYSQCGGFDSARYSPDPPADSNCIIYQYDVSNTLTIRHQNATFNCCVQELSAVITVTDNVIDIAESETAPEPCFCVCAYDLDVRVINLVAGEYTINITSPYLTEPITVDVDLINEPAGYFCTDLPVPE
ncbi:MAG: hypothetical protein JSW34_01150 [Candidatus Zixiibacteriota bacterium]|nr:MAG: hypothetical protein JSW34_01150 [candidate division Zixibacteria bacterium]